MILGSGDIAKSLTDLDQPDIFFFASGVSNSRCEDHKEFERERDLFDGVYQRNGINLHRVYFSSLSVYYSDSEYVQHKRLMEERITWGKWSYTIIRLGNIVWGSNPHTIINYFKSCYSKSIQPELQDTYRHLVTRQEFEYWIKKIRPGVNDIMNIPGEFIHVKEIWKRVQNGEY